MEPCDHVLVFVILCILMSATGQQFVPPHRAVLNVEAEESHLPPDLRSHALDNPLLAHTLRKTSWFHHGERPVFERETEMIPRQSIVSVLTHAGFVPRRPGHEHQLGNIGNGDGGLLSALPADFPLADLALQFI